MSAPPAFLNQLFTRKLFASAGISLLVYDHLLTFSLEVAYIWDSPWTFVKALFLANRYGNLIGQIFILLEETGYLNHNSQHFCGAFQLYLAFFAVFSGESIRLLVVMRACAIMGFKRNVTVLANTLYVLCATTILAVSLYWLRDITLYQFEYLDEIGVCFAPLTSNVWMLWLIPLFLDGFMFANVSSSLFRLFRLSLFHHPSRLIHLLARDALLFYVVALLNVLLFIVCWTVYRLDPRNAIPTVFSFPFLSVIGQRLILNLRSLQSRPDSTREVSREIRRQMAAVGVQWSHHLSDPDIELEEFGGTSGITRDG